MLPVSPLGQEQVETSMSVISWSSHCPLQSKELRLRLTPRHARCRRGRGAGRHALLPGSPPPVSSPDRAQVILNLLATSNLYSIDFIIIFTPVLKIPSYFLDLFFPIYLAPNQVHVLNTLVPSLRFPNNPSLCLPFHLVTLAEPRW